MVYELRCVPVVLATVSAIDVYGFSFNYVGRGNTTDNTIQSLYDFFFIEYNCVCHIHIHIHIHIHG